MRGANVSVVPVDNGEVDRKLPVVTALPIKKSFFLNVEIPFKSVSKAEKVMDSVLDSQLPFAIDDSSYVFKSTSSTSLSGSHKFIVFGSLTDVLQEFIESSSQRYTCVTHQGVAIWDGVQSEKVPISNEICFVYFEYNNQGCLLFGFNNTLEACYSLPPASIGRLNRIVKAIKAKYQIQFEMAKNICWTNVSSDISNEFSTTVQATVTTEFGYNYFKLKDSEFFLQKVLAKQFLKKKTLNLVSGEEFVTEAELVSRDKYVMRSATVLFTVSVISLVIAIAVNMLAKQKLYNTDDKITSFASKIAGYNIPSAMKGETVYRATVQATKKRKDLLQLFDINPPESIKDVWNVIKQYKSDGDIAIHSIDISQQKIIVAGTLKDDSTLTNFLTKLDEVGYTAQNLEKTEATGNIPCKLVISKLGDNDE
jgi:hypothetical protein